MKKNSFAGKIMQVNFIYPIPFLSLILFFLISSNSNAQKYKFENLTSDNGLSQNLISTLYQDSHHFLWIGTTSGLNKYDGAKFTIYKNDPKNSNSVGGKHFTSIVEDKDGNLWIGSYNGGVSKYIRNMDSFIQYKADPNNPNSLSSDRVSSLVLDRSGKLWVGSEDGLSCMNISNGKSIRFKANPSSPDSLCCNQITNMMQDVDGKIWIGTWEGLSVLDPKTRTFKNYLEHKSDPTALNNGYIYKVYQDKEKNIWVGAFDGLYRYNKQKNNFTGYHFNPANPTSINNGTVNSILEDKQGNFWIASNPGGLHLFDRKKNIFIHFKADQFDRYSLRTESIFCLLEDDAGLMWIGSFGGGLYKLDFRKSQFHYFENYPLSTNSLSSNRISSFWIDKDKSVWIGNLDGSLDHMIRKENVNTFSRYYDPGTTIETKAIKPIYGIAGDQQGNIWLGVKSGLKKFDPRTKSFTFFNELTDNVLKNNSVLSVIVDHKDKLWVGTYRGGLSYYDKAAKKFHNYSHDKNNSSSLVSNVIRYLYEDHNKNIWVCTEEGLDLFDQANQKFIHYRNKNDNDNSLIDNFALLIYEDSQNNMWVGTPSGLSKMEGNYFFPNSVKFSRFTTNDGLPSNNIQGIEEDAHGNLWISTINGLSKFYPAQKAFKNYDVSDGLLSNEFYVTAIAKLPDTGEILIGCNKGVNVFHPDSIKEEKYLPPIVLTGLSITNKPIQVNQQLEGRIPLPKAISEIEEVELKYWQNTISLEFAALSFSNPTKNIFKYKMEGLNDDWIDLGNKHDVSFINLSPGEYVFRVKAANHSGIWSDKEARLKIVIDPPFWQTFIFKFFIVILIGFGFVRFYKTKTANIKRRSFELQGEVERQTRELRIAKEAAEAANKFKSDFLANTSHELRTPLNAILGYTQILRRQPDINEKNKDQLLTIQKSGEHLLLLINDILDLRRIEVKGEQLSKTEFDLAALIQEVLSTIRVKALEKDLSFEYSESSTIPKIVVGDVKKIRQILLNLLGNAVKYTRKGFVKLDVKCDVVEKYNSEGPSANVVLCISDSGIGISKERFDEIFTPFSRKETMMQTVESSGLGLAITKRLVELMGGKINVVSEVDKGTSFTLELEFPIKKHFAKANVHPNERIIGYKGERKNILIVDDHDENRSLLLSLLEPLNFKIDVAENGNIALEKIQNFNPHLILVDMLMPKMDGNELIKKIKLDSKFDKVKIIGISAAVADLKRTSVFSDACDDFISKPIDSEWLLNKIGDLLKLDWKTENFTPATSIETENEDSQNVTLNIPAKNILEQIINSVNIGDYAAIQLIIKNELSSEEYKEFRYQLLEFAKQFDDDSIITLCKTNLN